MSREVGKLSPALQQELGRIEPSVFAPGVLLYPCSARNMRTWNGDSRGRWGGKTLVVDTTNFSPESCFMGSTEGLSCRTLPAR